MNLNLYEPQEIDCTQVEIPMKEVLKRIGYPPGYQEKNPVIQNMMDEALHFVRDHLAPKGILRILQIEDKTADSTLFKDVSFSITSQQVNRLLRNSEKAVLFMATIGDTIENRIAHLMDSKDMTRSVILDAFASETADAVADLLHRSIVKKEASTQNLKVTARFSPGYGDWPIAAQSDILKICRGDKIGITLNESCLMHPRKSVSAIFGLNK